MEIDSKTIIIFVLGALLLFMVFQISDSGSKTTGAAIGSQQYGGNSYAGGQANARAVNNLPSMVGGC